MDHDTSLPKFRNVTAIVSLGLGLLGIPSMAADPAFGLLFGVAGVVVGAFGLRQARNGAPGRGIAIAGVVLGLISLVTFGIAAWLISQDLLA
jgi:hypothetical protein